MFITQSAVSRQVKALEEQLGVPLFTRRYRAIELTDAGQTLYRAVSEAMHLIADTTQKLSEGTGAKSITVSCTMGFASLWLVPNLAGFRATHPDVDLRISALNRMVDLEREHIEVAIRYCLPEVAPAGAVRLFGSEQVFPVCSPALLGDPARPLATPGDLVHHVLLHVEDENRRPTAAWETWLEVVNLQQLKPAGSLYFTHDDHLMQAAIDGQGVALGLAPLIQRFIREGKLTAPFAEEYTPARGYYLIVAKRTADRPEVRHFCQWMEDVACRDSAAR
jgi:DNA-binding transcriptional LysR family regulator